VGFQTTFHEQRVRLFNEAEEKRQERCQKNARLRLLKTGEKWS
jgi:hypothetical protein